MALSLNGYAKDIWHHLYENKERYRVQEQKLSNGSKVLDCGVKVEGSVDAGIKLALASIGGLGSVRVFGRHIGRHYFPHVLIESDHPAHAMLGCQMGWLPGHESLVRGVVSGPGRVLAHQPTALFHEITLKERSDEAVFVLQSSQLPSTHVAQQLADYCNVAASNLYLFVAPMQSIAGTVQISSRSVEAVMLKLWKVLQYDPNKVRYAIGQAPVSPPALKKENMRCLLPDDMLV
ncbi:MAG: methenyltetrahydromethanopterin cyclohydrolase, partial [Candidatus Ranarchaeia archaeon]